MPPKDDVILIAEEQMDSSRPKEKATPHKKLKTEEGMDNQGKIVEEDEYRSGQPIEL